MRLLIISSNSPYQELEYVRAPVGGAEWGLRLLAEHAARTVEVVYLSTAHTRLRPLPSLARDTVSGVSVLHLTGPSVPGLQPHLHAARRRAWLGAVERAAREQGSDVILSYATVPDTLAAVRAKAGLPGVKVAEWMAGRGWELHVGRCPADIALVREAFEGKDATFFETRALRDYTDEAERRAGIRRSGADVFVEFASASRAHGSDQAAAEHDRPPLVLCAASFKPGSKRQDLLVEAWPEVLRRVPGARLVLAGDGPLREACAALVRERGLATSVDLPGMVERERLGVYLGTAALFALPTEFEGRPQAVLEAIEARVPVVTSDIPAHRELFESEPLLVQECLAVNTAEAFAERISHLLTDADAREAVRGRTDALASAVASRRAGALDRIVAALEAL